MDSIEEETFMKNNISFRIILADENRLIGDMGISFTNHNNMQAELGCTLHKDYQKKGYATEALKAIVDYLFGTLDKHRIIASVDPRNTASIQLIERLGFRKEAHFKESYYLRGDWVDDIIYVQLKTGLYTVQYFSFLLFGRSWN